MSAIPAISLSRLQFPDLTQAEDLEQIVASLEEHCAKVLAASLPDGSAPIDLKTPLIQAPLKTMGMREQRLIVRINAAARGVMLATASGSDLDHVAALHGAKRLEGLVAGSEELELESDQRLRIRARLAMGALSQAGTEGLYRFHALSASPDIKDISVFASDQDLGKVHVCVLSRYERGGELDSDPAILEAVKDALRPVQSVTDSVEVKWAAVYPYNVKATLILEPEAEPAQIQPKVLAAVTELIHDNHQLGKELLRDEFFAAMYQTGVAEVILEEPAIDHTQDLDTAPFNAADPENEDTLLLITFAEL